MSIHVQFQYFLVILLTVTSIVSVIVLRLEHCIGIILPIVGISLLVRYARRLDFALVSVDQFDIHI